MTDYEHLKLCAARYVWRIQNERIPFPVETGTGHKKRFTWLEWWEHKFQDNYREYVNGQKGKKEKAEKIQM